MADDHDSNTPPKTKVGYRNPPRHTRFRKGQSGNPQGARLHKKPDLPECLEKIINEKVTVRVEGRKTRQTRLEVAIRQLMQSAMTGSRLALRDVLWLRAECHVVSEGNQRPVRYANFPPRAANMEEWLRYRQGSVAHVTERKAAAEREADEEESDRKENKRGKTDKNTGE
ncbi:DUF5681 domain-containing protein [Parvibaculum sp.]|uniref:DUF5681 domain-containing protein n=1 Tax=Parvibaculum sp. TaxID=2024848 RepID=UPI0039193D88